MLNLDVPDRVMFIVFLFLNFIFLPKKIERSSVLVISYIIQQIEQIMLVYFWNDVVVYISIIKYYYC